MNDFFVIFYDDIVDNDLSGRRREGRRDRGREGREGEKEGEGGGREEGEYRKRRRKM